MAAPTALGGIVVLLILPGFSGAIIGIIVTAIASAATTPTRGSFITNLLLCGAGCILGFFVGMARAEQLPRDRDVISRTAVFGAVLAGGTHEVVRWSRKRR